MISVGVAILALKILNAKNDRKLEKIKKIQDLCRNYNANVAIKVSSNLLFYVTSSEALLITKRKYNARRCIKNPVK